MYITGILKEGEKKETKNQIQKLKNNSDIYGRINQVSMSFIKENFQTAYNKDFPQI